MHRMPEQPHFAFHDTFLPAVANARRRSTRESNRHARARCSACDCEYVALAGFLDVKLVTAEAKLAKAFPRRVTTLSGA
jgi:hypothetical protein